MGFKLKKIFKKVAPALASLGGAALNVVAPGVGSATLGAYGSNLAQKAQARDQKAAIKAQALSSDASGGGFAMLPSQFGGRLAGMNGLGPMAYPAPALTTMRQEGDVPGGLTRQEYDAAYTALSYIAQGYSNQMVRGQAAKDKVGKKVILRALPFIQSLDIGAQPGVQEWVLTGMDKANLANEVERVFRPRPRGIVSKSLIRMVNQLRFVRRALQAAGPATCPPGRKR